MRQERGTAMQTRAVCFHCVKTIDYDPVFEAVCGHDECPSATFHGICLMEWRDLLQHAEKAYEKVRREYMEKHTDNERRNK